ncbi:hypothetical protein pb186bvf_002586 [Paramecium bursaria]
MLYKIHHQGFTYLYRDPFTQNDLYHYIWLYITRENVTIRVVMDEETIVLRSEQDYQYILNQGKSFKIVI